MVNVWGGECLGGERLTIMSVTLLAYQEVSSEVKNPLNIWLRSTYNFFFSSKEFIPVYPFFVNLCQRSYFSDPMMLSLLPRDCSSMRRNMIRCMEKRKGKISSTFCEGAGGQGNSE